MGRGNGLSGTPGLPSAGSHHLLLLLLLAWAVGWAPGPAPILPRTAVVNHRRQRQQRAGHRRVCQQGTGTRGFQKRCKIQLSALAALLPLPSTAQSGIPARAAAWYPHGSGQGWDWVCGSCTSFAFPSLPITCTPHGAEPRLPFHSTGPGSPCSQQRSSLSPIRAPSTSFGSSPCPHILPAFSPVPAESLPLPEHPKIPVSLQRNLISASAAACFSFPRMAKPPSQEEGVQ